MFRYKGSRGSSGLVEEHSKISRLSSGDSCSSKDGMEPGKDSWVFSKDGSRKYSNNKKRSSRDHDSSYSIREETVVSPPVTPVDENMKVNVLYRGMVYRIRGIKIICSILAGIILLLAAVIILGVWIILGASDDGKFYFPWSSVELNNETSESNAFNASKYMATNYTNLRMPQTTRYREEISFKIPSAEVGEALGHLKAAHPRPAKSSRQSTTETTSSSSVVTYNDEYYDEYDDEYYEDLIDEYSLLHPTLAEPSAEFKRKVSENDNLYPREQRADNFRVHFDGYKDSSGDLRNESPEDSKQKSFRASPIIHEISQTEKNVKDKLSRSRGPSRHIDMFVSESKESPTIIIKRQKHPERTFTNSHGADNSKPTAQEAVVEYDGVLLNANQEESVTYYDDEEGDYHLKPTPESLIVSPENTKSEKNDEQINIQEKFVAEPELPKPLFVEEVVIEEDPHRKLFLGNYGRGEIILEKDNFQRRVANRTLNDRQTFTGPIDTVGILGYQNKNRRQYPIKNQQVSGTVHPIPHVRRSHISAGFRPRLNNVNVDFIRMRDRQNTHLANQAERIAQQVRAQSVPISPVSRMDGPLNQRPMQAFQNGIYPRAVNRLPPGVFPGQHQVQLPFELQFAQNAQQKSESGFMNALQSMYEYSRKVANTLLKFPQSNSAVMANTTTDFLKNSFGLLENYDHVFSNLPQVFMEPLIKFQLPSAEQIENLNPFQLSLMTWTFVDFWEFLIEKVGTLSREDLRTLELRLANIRQTKDSRIAKALIIDSNADENIEDEEMKTAAEALELSLKENNESDNSDLGLDKMSSIPDKAVPEKLNTQTTMDEQSRFMQYTIKTLFNFGKVYLRSDYALDCMMLLFCKDINSKTKQGGMDGVAARLKRLVLSQISE